jgi:hypothetical protein
VNLVLLDRQCFEFVVFLTIRVARLPDLVIATGQQGCGFSQRHWSRAEGYVFASAGPLFPDAAVFAKYQRRAFTARSEIRETVTRTLETIAQTQALMARVDALSKGVAGSSMT